MAFWRTVHAIENPRLLLGSLDVLQEMGLIISMSSDGIKAKSFLRIRAMLVPVDEDDILIPWRYILKGESKFRASL